MTKRLPNKIICLIPAANIDTNELIFAAVHAVAIRVAWVADFAAKTVILAMKSPICLMPFFSIVMKELIFIAVHDAAILTALAVALLAIAVYFAMNCPIVAIADFN